ncbi:MAG TPA: S24 family peptidase [Candidatus Saccharimonadales bacterium]|jgi:SOS-response transcriptional repressor LexA|nr:S24 family peptidase [Candidatus Saccharimonadales bacterium]
MPGPNADAVVVHAGFPNPATDTSLVSLDLNQLLIAHAVSTFFFTIEGNEWEREGIFTGDIAIVDRIVDPRSSDRVIWHHDGQGAFAISQRRAVPEDARIWGVVTAVIHLYRNRDSNAA